MDGAHSTVPTYYQILKPGHRNVDNFRIARVLVARDAPYAGGTTFATP